MPRRAIDLGALFAPRSIAVVGASPRSGIAQTVRDNVGVMGGDTPAGSSILATRDRRHSRLSVEPRRPAGAPTGHRRGEPAACGAVRRGGGRTPACRSVVIPGGGVVEGGGGGADAARGPDAREHGLAVLGPNCMGRVDWTTRARRTSATSPVSAARRRRGHRPVGPRDRCVHPRRHPDRVLADHRLRQRGVLDVCDFLAYCLDDPETHAVMLFVEGFKRPERFLALADHALELGKPILAVKVGRSDRRRPRPWRTPAISPARTGSPTPRCGPPASSGATTSTSCSRRPSWSRARGGWAGGVGRGRTGVVTVSTGEASLIADLAPRTGVDLPPVPDGAARGAARAPADARLHRQPARSVGRDRPDHGLRAAFDTFAESGAYDVIALVHDFPYRSLPRRSRRPAR